MRFTWTSRFRFVFRFACGIPLRPLSRKCGEDEHEEGEGEEEGTAEDAEEERERPARIAAIHRRVT